MNYYNEIDDFAADWLRGLIEAGEIPRGNVDTRSIEEVTADDVRGYGNAIVPQIAAEFVAAFIDVPPHNNHNSPKKTS